VIESVPEVHPLSKVPSQLKIVLHFRNVGDAPILVQTKFKLLASYKFSHVEAQLRGKLGIGSDHPLFLYINQSFSPCSDVSLFDLFQNYAVRNELIVNYAYQDAWG